MDWYLWVFTQHPSLPSFNRRRDMNFRWFSSSPHVHNHLRATVALEELAWNFRFSGSWRYKYVLDDVRAEIQALLKTAEWFKSLPGCLKYDWTERKLVLFHCLPPQDYSDTQDPSFELDWIQRVERLCAEVNEIIKWLLETAEWPVCII